MAACCAHCGGCCAHCASTCGMVGGAHFGSSFGAPFMGNMGGIGYFPFFGSRHRTTTSDDDTTTPVDADALVDPSHEGHQVAVQAISHVDDDTHDKITQWLKQELHLIEHGDSPSA